jgi:hypothetical protein
MVCSTPSDAESEDAGPPRQYFRDRARRRAGGPHAAIHLEYSGSDFVQLQCAVLELRRQPGIGREPGRSFGLAGFETQRFTNAPGAAIDYIHTSARAQYINSENDQDYSPFFSYVPRLDFDPTFANNLATRQDLNLGRQGVQLRRATSTGFRPRPTARDRRSGRSASAPGYSGGSAIRLLNLTRCFSTHPPRTSSPSSGTPGFP